MTLRTCVEREFIRTHLDELFEIEDNLQTLMLDYMLENSMHFITTFYVTPSGGVGMSFKLVKQDPI